MAESESGADKSEQPTAKRLSESRRKGQIARSKELSTLAVTLGGAIALLLYGQDMAHSILGIMRACFSFSREWLFDTGSMARLLGQAGDAAFWLLLPFLLILLVASILGPISLGGWNFSLEAMQPKLSKMNPLSGVKRMFSVNALVELGKALAKFVVILVVALLVLSWDRDALTAIAYEPLEAAIGHSAYIVAWSAFWLACGLILIAAVDAPFQLWSMQQKLKMTKQEVRDEHKQSEGSPEVKGRIRQTQREMAQRRMLESVPKADVVITNPTHFAVALKYDADSSSAPIMLAKGGDFLALKIREVANEHEILVLESPSLARAIYYSTEVDREIPAGLYLAVAQVLAYVYQVRQYKAGLGQKPTPLADPPIPDDLKRD